MRKTISATDAKSKLPTIFQDVADGHSYLVTIHGRAIAQIGPVAPSGRLALAARAALLARLERQTIIRTSAWTRDDLYNGDR
ncbi:hypothetical protein LH128_03409 [Sphingomonas sp. LH128]|jgi:hypothetical protein|nr:hypothetical protein LH128_03409 [Sphingomonas sp. LH128]